jgi:hypothetical protein
LLGRSPKADTRSLQLLLKLFLTLQRILLLLNVDLCPQISNRVHTNTLKLTRSRIKSAPLPLLTLFLLGILSFVYFLLFFLAVLFGASFVGAFLIEPMLEQAVTVSHELCAPRPSSWLCCICLCCSQFNALSSEQVRVAIENAALRAAPAFTGDRGLRLVDAFVVVRESASVTYNQSTAISANTARRFAVGYLGRFIAVHGI